MGTPPPPAELLSHCPPPLKFKISLTEPGFLGIGGVGWAHSVAGGSPLSRPPPQGGDFGGGAGELVFPGGVTVLTPLSKKLRGGAWPLLSQPYTPGSLGFLASARWVPGCKIRSLGPINLEAKDPGGCAGQKARPSGRRQQRAALRRARSPRVGVSSRRLRRATLALA